MADYLYHHNANTHWAFPTSQETDEALADARQVLADFLNASPAEIAFGANMTTLTFHLARALGRRWGPGDEIVVTELDHHANVDPWRALERERGVTVRVARMIPETGQTRLRRPERQINGRTRLVAIGAASNALGTITDVAEAAGWPTTPGPSRSSMPSTTRRTGWSMSRRSAATSWPARRTSSTGRTSAFSTAGTSCCRTLDVPKLQPAPETAPERLETGTQNHEGIVGAAAAVEFLASLADGPDRRSRLRDAFEGLHERGQKLDRKALGWAVADRVGSGSTARRPLIRERPTVSFTVGGHPVRRGLPTPGGPGALRLEWRLLRQNGRRAAGPGREGLVRVGAGLLHDGGRDGTPPRRGAVHRGRR